MSSSYWAGVAWADLQRQHLSAGDWRMHTGREYAIHELPDGEHVQLIHPQHMTALTCVPIHVLRAEEMHLALLALGMRADARDFRFRMRQKDGIGSERLGLLQELLPWLTPAIEQLPSDHMTWQSELGPIADRLALSLLWIARACGHARPESAASQSYQLVAALAVRQWAGL